MGGIRIPQYHILLTSIPNLEAQISAKELRLTCTAPRYLMRSGDRYYTEWIIQDAEGRRVIMWAEERQGEVANTAAFTVGNLDRGKGIPLLKEIQPMLAAPSVKIYNPERQLYLRKK